MNRKYYYLIIGGIVGYMAAKNVANSKPWYQFW